MILFPTDTLERSEVERDYRAEFEAAHDAGFDAALFDFDGLRRGEPIAQVLRRVPEGVSPQTLIYRGWMLSATDYARLFNGLHERGWTLINNAQEYRFGHHAPENYAFWKERMPQTTCIGRDKFEQNGEVRFAPIFEALDAFGNSPVIVKDWVKSQKHRWNEACFIPDASDKNEVRRVVTRFLELQGDYLTGGLVFRRFEKLSSNAGNRPLEWRSFWLDGKYLSLAPTAQSNGHIPIGALAELARVCPSRFFTLDFAQRENGEWIIIEMGDGGVSGLPPGQNIKEWYLNLKRSYEARV